MSERPSLPAVYDSDRLPNGQFRPGNGVSRHNGNEVSKRFRDLRNAWYDATTPEDMTAVQTELKSMCLKCPVPDVKLRAIVYFLDRCLGKPVERLDIDVTDSARPAPVVDLSSEEIRVLERVVQRVGPDLYEVQDSITA